MLPAWLGGLGHLLGHFAHKTLVTIHHALSISTRAWVLENGAITLFGTGAEVLADEHTRRAYLGV